MSKAKHDPAFPITPILDYSGEADSNHMHDERAGMSKRFYAACAAMQGYMSAGTLNPYGVNNNIKEVVENSYEIADELLKQEYE